MRNQKANAFTEDKHLIRIMNLGECYVQRKETTAMAIISRSVLTVSRTTTVKDAVELMASAKVGSVVVVDGDRLAGIFSERDVMLRVVLEGRDPKQTTVEEVMTAQVHSISMRTTGDEALKIMIQEHIRHLPVVDEQGRPQAIVSMRSLLEEKVKELHQQLDSLESYMSADGIGG
jgi:CBS domain-containing protein